MKAWRRTASTWRQAQGARRWVSTQIDFFLEKSLHDARDVAADQTLTLTPCFIDGDADGDRTVGMDDLALTLTGWGTGASPYRGGDVTGDGVVDFRDLNQVLDAWGAGCD